VAFVNLNFKHGIGEGLQYFALDLNFILFWHNILSLAAGLHLLIPIHMLADPLRVAAFTREYMGGTGTHGTDRDALETIKGQQYLLLRPTMNYSILS